MDPNHLADPSEKKKTFGWVDVKFGKEKNVPQFLIWFMTKYLKTDHAFPSASETLLGVFTSSNVTENYNKMYKMFLAIL